MVWLKEQTSHRPGLQMEGGSTSETSVNVYRTAQYHITTVRTSSLALIGILSDRFSDKNFVYNSCFSQHNLHASQLISTLCFENLAHRFAFEIS
jgi:hypothetical protein